MTEPAQTEPVKKEPRKWIHWLVTAMVFVALYAWMTRGNASPLMGEPAPDLTLAVAAGAEAGGPTKVTLSDMGGQVVVLDFWASWCGRVSADDAYPQRSQRRVRRAGRRVLRGQRRADRQATPASSSRGLRHRVSKPSRSSRDGSKTIRRQDAPDGHHRRPGWHRSLGFYWGSKQNAASRGDF